MPRLAFFGEEGGIARVSHCICDALVPHYVRNRPLGVLREQCSLVAHPPRNYAKNESANARQAGFLYQTSIGGVYVPSFGGLLPSWINSRIFCSVPPPSS
jgi:hypothetical protein